MATPDSAPVKKSIRLRLLLLIFVAGTLPALVLSVIASLQARRVLVDDALENVELLAEQKTLELRRFLLDKQDAVALMANDVRMSRFIENRGVSPAVNHEVMADWMARLRNSNGFDDIYLIDSSGEVHYSAREGPYPSMHFGGAPWDSNATGVAFKRLIPLEADDTAGPWFIGQSTLFGAPVRMGPSIVGYVLAELQIDEKVPFFQFERLKSSSVELVVGLEAPQGIYFLSSLPKMQEPGKVVPKSDLAEPMQRALSGQSGSGVLKDYVGDHVIAAWHAVPEWEMGIVVKIDQKEILSPVYAMQMASIPSAILILSFLLMASFFVSGSVVRRIQRLEVATRQVAGGKLDVMVEAEGSDEIASLAHSFNVMTSHLSQSVASKAELASEMTRRKQLEALTRQYVSNLEASNQDLEQFAYVASHDLQEPLRMVASYTQLLERRYGDKLDDDAREFMRYAVDGARRMQQLVNDLLQYSRISTQGEEFRPVDLHEVTSRALITARMAPGGTEALFIVDSLPSVVGDSHQLERLMANLFTNAIKYRSPDPVLITVSAESRADEWIISVKDNGIGIDPQFHTQIFQIFQRLHPADAYPGTGLGLAICQRVVKRHGGRIWVESDPSQGPGSRFRFSLPKTRTIEP